MKTPAKTPPTADAHDEDGVVNDAPNTELTTSVGTAVAVLDDYDGYAADAGAGFENQTSEDTSIPFLVVLQPGSPEVQDENGSARPGMIVNKTTGELTKGSDGVTIIPALTEHLLVEWKPRDAGGGLVATHAIDSDLARKVRATQPLGTYKHPDNGNDLVETFYVYGVALTNEGFPYPATAAFSSTHIKPYQDWMFRARSLVIVLPDGRKITKVPLFSHAYRLRTLKQEKNGNTWFVPVVGFAGENAEASRLAPSSTLYQEAKRIKESILSGALKADVSGLSGGGEPLDRQPAKASASQVESPY